MARTSNPVLRPPPDLLNGLPWLLLMANLARNEQREEFGSQRLIDPLNRINADHSEQGVYRVMRAVETFSSSRADDRSCVAVRYTGASLKS